MGVPVAAHQSVPDGTDRGQDRPTWRSARACHRVQPPLSLPDSPEQLQRLHIPCKCKVHTGRPCGLRKRSYLRVVRVPGMACDRPVLLVLNCGELRVTECDSRREDKCGPCSAKHKRYLIRRAESGLELGGQQILATFTAPGTEDHDRLDPKLAGVWCNSRHRSPRLGWRRHCDPRPLCACALPAGGLEEWNPAAGARWNVLRLALSRLCDGQLHYFRVVEIQKRGAIHLHILLRVPVGAQLDPYEVQRLALAAGFGCNVDLSPMSDKRAARYVAKYAAKSYCERAEVPWKDEVLDKETGELRTRQMAAYRTVSQSRDWGLTLKAIRAAIRESIQRSSGFEPLTAEESADLRALALTGPAPPPT